MGEYSKVIEVASEVVTLLEETQRQREFFGRPYTIYAILLAEKGTCMWRMGNYEEGETSMRKGLDFALEMKDIFSLSMLELHHGLSLNLKGDAKAAIEHCKNSIRYCEEGQIAAVISASWLGLGWGYYLLGELETAREYIEKGLKMKKEGGAGYDFGFFYGLLSAVRLELGDRKSAQDLAEEALKISQRNHEKPGEGFAWMLLGRILGKAGESQSDKAEECILRGIKIFEERNLKLYYLPGYYFLGELYADTGKEDKARETLRRAEVMFREMGMDYWLARTQEVMRRL
jgi:tetratricopeptide (TPR) repeat protein